MYLSFASTAPTGFNFLQPFPYPPGLSISIDKAKSPGYQPPSLKLLIKKTHLSGHTLIDGVLRRIRQLAGSSICFSQQIR